MAVLDYRCCGGFLLRDSELLKKKVAKNMNAQEMDLDKLEMASNMLKAMAHPMRIAILKYLEGGKRSTVTEIHEFLGIEQSTTSHHLGILKDKGVLCSRREGKNTYYFLKHDKLSQIVDCLQRCSCE